MSLIESPAYYSVKILGACVRRLPIAAALGLGRLAGTAAYYLDFKHKSVVLTNLKTAFADSKSPEEIKSIAKTLFQNFGQNFIELLRLPLMNQEMFTRYVKVEGREHALEALKKGKGLILLAMHYGSWEIANLAATSLGRPYKVLVKPQDKFSRLDDLLNSYRSCGGSVVIERGLGTREFITSLKNNEIIGMVMDQGGKDGVLVPFFDRQASMAAGAIRVGLKLGVPVCFAVIMREQGPYHRLIIHEPLVLEPAADIDEAVRKNVTLVAQVMENYITQRPAEYMWFYKIWKYSRQVTIAILDDGRTGHLRQAQTVAHLLAEALKGKGILPAVKILPAVFKSQASSRWLAVLSAPANPFLFRGRLGFLRNFLTEESFDEVLSVRADFIISCGSSTAALNYLLANDQQVKSVVIQRPGILNPGRYDLVLLPQHDKPVTQTFPPQVVFTQGAPNLITAGYLEQQAEGLINRFPQLKIRDKYKIGLLIGGDTGDFAMSESLMKMLVHQVREVVGEINADILATTSRRTPVKVENMLQRELKQDPRCRLLVIANRQNVPEAVGGILGLADVLIVSGDSISMISEAASSGKKTLVFPIRTTPSWIPETSKHNRFIEKLNEQGFIVSADAKNIKPALYNMVKNKVQLRKLDDQSIIAEAVKRIL